MLMSADRTIDVLVIGAGIQGAGVAQAAAAAGHSVVVLEQYAGAAGGTSSRSSKLIHGGLRYLETGQVGLVRECLRERAILLRNAPGLVQLVPFLIPVYRDSMRPRWKIRAGLSLYAVLGGLGPDIRFQQIGREYWPDLDGLETHGLTSVFQYSDAQTDDAALTRAVLASAGSLGAEVEFKTHVSGIEIEGQGQVAVHARCGERPVTYHARTVVNATGPWADQVLKNVTPRQPDSPLELVQGTHIVVPGILGRGIYYLEAPADRRAVFVLPWQGQTMVGTTETVYHGDPGSVAPLDMEVDYLLETLGHYFPQRRLQRRDVLGSFAGLRVLPATGDNPNARTRDSWLLADNQYRPRLLSVLGGKLTAYRATAETVLERLRHSLPPSKPVADTRTLPLEDSVTAPQGGF